MKSTKKTKKISKTLNKKFATVFIYFNLTKINFQELFLFEFYTQSKYRTNFFVHFLS